MLRMVLLGLLIPLGVGVLAAMELRTPVRSAGAAVEPVAGTTAGISGSQGTLAKADRLEVAAASSEAPMQPALEHDPEKWVPVFPATNAKRLRGDHAQNEEQADEGVSAPEGISTGASEPPRVINRHRHDPKPKKVTTATPPKSRPRKTDIKRTTIAERRKAASETEPCRLSAFGGLRKALNSADCEI